MKYFYVIICLLLLLPVTVYAEGDGESDDVKDALDSYCSSLPKEIRKELPEGLTSSLTGEGGDTIGAEYVIGLIAESVRVGAGGAAPFILALIVTVLLSSTVCALGDGISDKPVSVVASVATCSLCISALLPLLKEVRTATALMGAAVKGVMPAVALLGASSAQPSLTSANASFISTLLALNTKLSEELMGPSVSVCLSFSVAGALSKHGTVFLGGVASLIKRILIFVLTLTATALSVIMSFQTVLAKSSDTLLLRGIRFATGNAVPIIGGTVSEVAGGYLSGLAALKGGLGTVCALSVAVCALPLTVKLFAVRIGMSGVALLAQAMGSPLHSDIKELCSAADILIAVTVLVSLTFTVSVGVFAAVSV